MCSPFSKSWSPDFTGLALTQREQLARMWKLYVQVCLLVAESLISGHLKQSSTAQNVLQSLCSYIMGRGCSGASAHTL